jgi:transcriptional regulator with XRE-family HTH domain
MADVRKQFGLRLRQLRQQRELTQEDLAFAAQMDVGYLSQIERGVGNPSLVMIADLALAMKVQPTDLMENVTVKARNTLAPRKRPRS